MGVSAANISLIRQAFANAFPVIQFLTKWTAGGTWDTLYSSYIDLTDIEKLKGTYILYNAYTTSHTYFQLDINGTTYIDKDHTGTTSATIYKAELTIAAIDKAYVLVEMKVRRSSQSAYVKDIILYPFMT